MDASTRLDALSIPYLEVVLDEVFNIPPSWLAPSTQRPATVGDLASMAGDDWTKVLQRLQSIVQMSNAIEITPTELQQALADPAPPLLLDVREPWEFELCHLPGSLLLTAANFDELLPRLRTEALVITVCHHGVRSYSAAMFLREAGVHARSLTGGVERWAIEVAPQMPRY